MKNKPVPSMDKDSSFKNILLIITTLIALASLILNFYQLRSSEQLQIFNYLSEYPAITTFRVKLSKNNIDKILALAESGTQFSYIPNPSILNYNQISNIKNDGAVVQFVVIVNENSEVPVTKLKLLHSNKSFPDININYLAPQSTILIPELIQDFGKDDTVIGNISEIYYEFSLGANELNNTIQVPAPNAEAVILEVGIGPIPKFQIPFEEP
jgi:hypothetical protein